MSSISEQEHPGQIFGRRVEEARKRRGWTQEQLAAELRRLGSKGSRSTVAKIEGRGQRATYAKIEDLFAFAAALGVPPVHLLVPLEDATTVALTPRVRVPAPAARKWIRGELLAVPMVLDVDPRDIPESELVGILEEGLSRGADRITLALAHESIRKEAERIADLIRNPKEATDA
jgi:transcriptional regulator with XRE-family HTH domain